MNFAARCAWFAFVLDGCGKPADEPPAALPVAQKRPNAFGLFDVHGNAWGWCADVRGDYPTGSVTDPTGASSSSFRIVRGGSCDNPAKVGRSAYRGGLEVDERASFTGFRPAKTVPMD